MMLRPLASTNPIAYKSNSKSSPCPTGGWNARDNIGELRADEAILLDNWYPEEDAVYLRRGYESHATGMSGAVETLMTWAYGASQKMFAANGSSIYDVSSNGAVGAADVGSLSNARWQHVNFGTTGGNFLICVNGSDDPLNYNGSAWATTPAITGVTPSTLIHVNAFKNRLFFIEKNTLSAWYLDNRAIGGTANELDFSSLCTLGGYLVSMGTWTRDGGSGIDDLAVWITSKGEAIVYQGTDPSDSTKWSLVGVFRIGAPVGNRCMFKVGSELVVITQDGFVPIGTALADARTQSSASLSDKIRGAVQTATRSYGSNFGWQAILYPKSQMGIFNVPVAPNQTAHQYVVNTTTGAWCRFKGMNANCWELYNDNLYFGGNGTVYKADMGTDDDGAAIVGEAKTAFDYMRQKSTQKRFVMVRPLITTSGSLPLSLGVNVDFSDTLALSTPTIDGGTSGSPWDTSAWDVSPWGIEGQVNRDWQSIDGIGYCVSLRMKVSTKYLEVKWSGTDYIYETGGFI